MAFRNASLVPALLAALLAGCATNAGPKPATDKYMVTVPKAPFYKYGPAQAFGADAVLAQGQRVTILSRDFGYSRVMIEGGQSGYVATDDIAPAPPEPPPPKATPRPVFASAPRRTGPALKPVPAPLFDVTDVPAPPLPKNPEKRGPAFRF